MAPAVLAVQVPQDLEAQAQTPKPKQQAAREGDEGSSSSSGLSALPTFGRQAKAHRVINRCEVLTTLRQSDQLLHQPLIISRQRR